MAFSRQSHQSFMKLALLVLTLATTVFGEGYSSRSKEDPPGEIIDTCPVTILAHRKEVKQCAAPKGWFPWEGDYAPWTQRPMCVKAIGHIIGSKDPTDMETFCSFTKTDFAEGRGVSMVTTARMGKIIADLPAFTEPESIKGINDLINGKYGPPPYKSRRFPIKGIGLVANRTIVRGERIMQETVTFLYHRNAYSGLDDEARVPLSWHSVYSLPDDTRDELLALHAHHGGDTIDDIMRTNAFGAYYLNEELHNNVLPRISRFNHDCRPNAHYYFDPETMTQYVHAVKEIAPGEEIVISYTDSEYTWEQRQHATMVSWGFACACSICRQPPDQVTQSDKRLTMIKALKELLNDWTEDRPDRHTMAELMIELYEQERLYVPVSTGYEAAAYAYSVMGDEYKTMFYASKAVDSLNIMYGGDHDLTKDLETMMMNPRAHRTWMYRIPKKDKSGELDELTEAD